MRSTWRKFTFFLRIGFWMTVARLLELLVRQLRVLTTGNLFWLLDRTPLLQSEKKSVYYQLYLGTCEGSYCKISNFLRRCQKGEKKWHEARRIDAAQASKCFGRPRDISGFFSSPLDSGKNGNGIRKYSKNMYLGPRTLFGVLKQSLCREKQTSAYTFRRAFRRATRFAKRNFTLWLLEKHLIHTMSPILAFMSYLVEEPVHENSIPEEDNRSMLSMKQMPTGPRG